MLQLDQRSGPIMHMSHSSCTASEGNQVECARPFPHLDALEGAHEDAGLHRGQAPPLHIPNLLVPAGGGRCRQTSRKVTWSSCTVAEGHCALVRAAGRAHAVRRSNPACSTCV